MVEREIRGATTVQVGKVMEITREEAMTLQECAHVMYSASQKQRKGWLMAYVRAHKEAHRVFQTIIRRSHANGGAQRGPGPRPGP